LAGRDDEVARVDLLIRYLEIGQAEWSPLITRLRGVGKTVLLNHFLIPAEKWNEQFASTRRRSRRITLAITDR